MVRRRHHLKQHLRKRHGGRPASIRSPIIRTPLTKNGENFLCYQPSQLPGHQYDGPTWRRQSRAARARYDYVRAPARPHTTRSSRQDPPSQTTGGQLASTEGARRRCRRVPAGQLKYIKSPSRTITRQLKSDIRECVRATRKASQYEDSGISMQKMDGGQARKAESRVTDNRGCPRSLWSSNSGTVRFPAASGRIIQNF